MARTRTPSQQTRIDAAINGDVQDAIPSTDSTRLNRERAWANFMNAGDDVLAIEGVSLNRRRVVAMVLGFVGACGTAYFLGVPLMTAAITLGGAGFIGFMMLCLSVAITHVASMLTFKHIVRVIDNDAASAAFNSAKTWCSAKLASLRSTKDSEAQHA